MTFIWSSVLGSDSWLGMASFAVYVGHLGVLQAPWLLQIFRSGSSSSGNILAFVLVATIVRHIVFDCSFDMSCL
jgi:hypothetical protein